MKPQTHPVAEASSDYDARRRDAGNREKREAAVLAIELLRHSCLSGKSVARPEVEERRWAATIPKNRRRKTFGVSRRRTCQIDGTRRPDLGWGVGGTDGSSAEVGTHVG